MCSGNILCGLGQPRRLKSPREKWSIAGRDGSPVRPSAIVAALSRGRVPSDPVPFTADTSEPYNILYASAGNEAAELVGPRFAKLDGDPARLVLLRGVLSPGSTQINIS
jgi:hypothetical protein